MSKIKSAITECPNCFGADEAINCYVCKGNKFIWLDNSCAWCDKIKADNIHECQTGANYAQRTN